MGKETRALSGDPVLLLLLLPLHPLQPPPLRFHSRYAESLLAPVCVKGEKEEEKKNKKKKKPSVCFCVLLSAPSLFWLSRKRRKKRKKAPPLLFDFLIDIHKLHWHDVFVGDGDCRSVTPKFAKSLQPADTKHADMKDYRAR